MRNRLLLPTLLLFSAGVAASMAAIPATQAPAQLSGPAGPAGQASPGFVPTGTTRPDPRTPYFTIDSRLAVGNKGEESLDVSTQGACGQPAWVFERAELEVHRSRFGTAQFVNLPPAGCVACTPIVVRWYHEPTGHLAFSVNVHRRLEIVQCPFEANPDR